MTITILIIIFVLFLAYELVVIVRSRINQRPIGSFWDVVKNPALMPDLDVIHSNIRESADTISDSPDEITKLVDYFIFEAESESAAWWELKLLGELGTKAYPRTLDILSDESLKEKLLVPFEGDGNGFSLYDAPICRLCKLFDRDAPPPLEASELLIPFFQCDEEEIRKNVALIIGSVGSVKSIPHLQQLLSDEEGYVKSCVLMGIKRAITGKRIEDSGKELFFNVVSQLWPKDTSFEICAKIPQVLIQLDSKRAIERLLEPDLFTTGFKPVWRILQALVEQSANIPREKLLNLISELNLDTLKYPMDNVIEQALALLGRYRNNEDLPLLEKCIEHPNEDISSGAVKGLYAYYQFREKVRDPWEIFDNKGWDYLSPVEKHVLAVQILDNEVGNGGFAQYYFNSSGNSWADAIDGLKAIGALKRLEILQQSLDMFPQRSPSCERSVRNKQLSKLVRKKDDPFKELDSAWYEKEDENLDILIFKHNIANIESLRKINSQ